MAKHKICVASRNTNFSSLIFQSPDNPTPYATTMLIGINSVNENCTKSNSLHEPTSSGTTTSISESTQPYHGAQMMQSKQMAYPQYPPGKIKIVEIGVFVKRLNFVTVPTNWADFLPPPPGHPPPIPHGNCNQNLGICFKTASPLPMNGNSQQMGSSVIPNHQK